MPNGPFMAHASSRAAFMKVPGCYAFTDTQPAVYKIAANGVDQIVDVEATEARYAGVALEPFRRFPPEPLD